MYVVDIFSDNTKIKNLKKKNFNSKSTIPLQIQ